MHALPIIWKRTRTITLPPRSMPPDSAAILHSCPLFAGPSVHSVALPACRIYRRALHGGVAALTVSAPRAVNEPRYNVVQLKTLSASGGATGRIGIDGADVRIVGGSAAGKKKSGFFGGSGNAGGGSGSGAGGGGGNGTGAFPYNP